MSRYIIKGDPGSRSSWEQEDKEEVRENVDRAGRTQRLHGDAIGKSPEELLEMALEQMTTYRDEVHKLLKHVPRRFEDRIKALDRPLGGAQENVKAVEILLRNVKRELA